MRRVLALIFSFLLLCRICSAQNVSNVAARQEGSSIIVSYDIDKYAPHINLTVSTDGGKTFSAPLKNVSGDVKDVSQGHWQIVWDVLSERDAFSGSNIVFNVVAASAIEYVDLGLSVLWATCNIGASEPQETGRFFAWGDVVGQTWNKESKTWSGGGFSKAPEYELETYDNQRRVVNAVGVALLGIRNSGNRLTQNYDAANVNLGGKWRMPTKEEFEELLKYCNFKKETNYQHTGVNGVVITSKMKGYTDKSIFLPYTGFGEGIEYCCDDLAALFFWSSTHYQTKKDNAAYLLFAGEIMMMRRDLGFPIRPVMDRN